MRTDGNGKFRLALLLLLAAPLLAPQALASSASPAGIAGRTNKSGGAGCATCHGNSADAGTVVAITGSNALNPGEQGTYTLTVTKAAANGTNVGAAIAASDTPTPLAIGTSMPQSLDAASGEVIHNAAVSALRTIASNSATYTFKYTMPAAASVGSTHTLYAVAAVSFLGWNHAPNFTVYTRPATTASVTPSSPTSSTINVAWTGGGPQYRVVYKTGAVAPANETDGTNAFEGAGTSTVVSGLSPSTQYTFRVFSKLTGQAIFSTTGANATASTTAVATVSRYVNAATGSNAANNCTSAGTPCRTITYAMSVATAGNPGDTVSVAPGAYNVALGEVFPITLKSGVALVSTGGPEATIIDGTGDTVKQGLIQMTSNASTAARIEGFTIANGLNIPTSQGGVALGGGVRVSSAATALTITRNIFRNNEARGYSADGTLGQTGGLGWGGGLYVFNSPVVVTNNVFVGNLARGGNGLDHPLTPVSGNETGGPGEGGAIYYGGSGSIVNNTFFLNRAIGGNAGLASNGAGTAGDGNYAGIAATGNPAPTIRNNIFMRNYANAGQGGTPGASNAAALLAGNSPAVTNNLFLQNFVNGNPSVGDTLGTATVTSDPLFHGAPSNLRLRVGSPASIVGSTTGAPAIDVDGTTRPVPPSIGAYEASAVSGGAANLSITNVAAPSPASSGKDVVFTITLTNAGPGVATGASVTNALPAGSRFVWASPGCTTSASFVTCPAGTLAAGASAAFKVVARPPLAASLQGVAYGSAAVDDASANVATAAVTVNASPAGTQALRYRLFSPVTSEHLYTTDLNEYNVLGSFVGTWVQEGTVGKVLNNPGSFGGVVATPYYRLYNTATAQHHWTTDPNEYYTLILFPQYSGEGVDGYILPTQAPGSVPLYRLLYPFSVPVSGLHHWTIDAAEYNALIASFGWIGEGGSGFVIP